VKDLLCLGRPLASTVIVDNSPHSYIFQPDNAVPISTFIDNMEDQVGSCFGVLGWGGLMWGLGVWGGCIETDTCTRTCTHPLTLGGAPPPPPPQELLEILPELLKVEAVDDVRTLLGPQNVANYHLAAPQPAAVSAVTAAAAAAPCAACGGAGGAAAGCRACGMRAGVIASVCVSAPPAAGPDAAAARAPMGVQCP
jgi:hypothetical protein